MSLTEKLRPLVSPVCHFLECARLKKLYRQEKRWELQLYNMPSLDVTKRKLGSLFSNAFSLVTHLDKQGLVKTNGLKTNGLKTN